MNSKLRSSPHGTPEPRAGVTSWAPVRLPCGPGVWVSVLTPALTLTPLSRAGRDAREPGIRPALHTAALACLLRDEHAGTAGILPRQAPLSWNGVPARRGSPINLTIDYGSRREVG